MFLTLISLINFINISHRQSINDTISKRYFLIILHIYWLYYHFSTQFQIFKWQTSILIDIKLGHSFSQSKTGFNYKDDKDLNKIETNYEDNKDLN